MARAALSVLLEGLRGKAGNVTFVKSREGTLVKPRVSPTNPQTKNQMAVRTALTQAAQAWTTLSADQVQAWNAYAALRPHLDNATNKITKSTGFNIFVKLTSKFFAVADTASGATFQTDPPTSTFVGDAITVSATSVAPGVIKFQASGENSEDVTTELLLQRLPNANRKPSKQGYRVETYATFEGTPPVVTVDASAGYYVAAYRFVNTVTGQMTNLVYLPVFSVALSMAKAPSSPTPTPKKKAA